MSENEPVGTGGPRPPAEKPPPAPKVPPLESEPDSEPDYAWGDDDEPPHDPPDDG
jgi:hypothetical protein